MNKTVCRVCLHCDLNTEDVSNIFEDSNNKASIYEKINTIAKVHIEPKDGLPDKICGDCLLELENAINFKQKCETSNSILVSAVNTVLEPEHDDENLLNAVTSELEEFAAQEYLEEDVLSPPEVKPDPNLQLGDTDLQLPAKKSKSIDLQLECHDCGGSFTSKCKLTVHWKKVHLKEQLTCPICLTTFGSFKMRKKHDINKTLKCKILSQVNVTGEGKHRVLHCKICEYSSSVIYTMSVHLVRHTGERNFGCKLCPKRYVQPSGLQSHMESRHGCAKQRLCKICGEFIIGKGKYDCHLKWHRDLNNYETCEICNRRIKKGGLIQHMAVHTNIRPFSCEKCAARFKLHAGLLHHERHVHQKLKYNCDKCEFQCIYHTSMRNHRNKHTADNFPCIKCGKFFENKRQLLLHIERHTNRNLNCPECNSTFFTKSSLQSHVNRIHKLYVA